MHSFTMAHMQFRDADFSCSLAEWVVCSDSAWSSCLSKFPGQRSFIYSTNIRIRYHHQPSHNTTVPTTTAYLRICTVSLYHTSCMSISIWVNGANLTLPNSAELLALTKCMQDCSTVNPTSVMRESVTHVQTHLHPNCFCTQAWNRIFHT